MVADLGVERGVVGGVDELEEVDERVEVVLAGLLVEDVGVGLDVVAAVAVVARALGLVEDAVVAEVGVVPVVVGQLDGEPQLGLATVDRERRGDRVLVGQAGQVQELLRDGLVQGGLGRAGADHDVGVPLDGLSVDVLVEADQPRQVLGVAGRGGGQPEQRGVALQAKADVLVGGAVDDDGRCDPVLLARGRVRVDDLGVVTVIEGDLDVVHHAAVEERGVGRDAGGADVSAVGGTVGGLALGGGTPCEQGEAGDGCADGPDGS